MAEDDGDKTEAATPRKREEAREQGQIARSADLTAAVLLLGFLMLMNSYGAGLVKALHGLMRDLLSADAFTSAKPDTLMPDMVRSLTAAGWAVLPLFVGAMMLALVMNVAQTGLVWTPQKLMPNFGAVNPMRGFGKIFKADNGVHLLINVIKIVLVGLIAWSAVKGRIESIVGAQDLDFRQAFGLTMSIIYAIGLRVALFLLVLALFDYGYQRYKHENDLKMTKQEVKDEMRRMEGDPKIKQRRKQIAQQMAAKRLAKTVPTADVVVTNPTHYAIALKYDSGAMHAPRVVAKGADLLAKRIRELAIANGIPIVERPPLARAMYRLVEVGQEIPEQFYSAVAEILAYVYELTGKTKQRQSA